MVSGGWLRKSATVRQRHKSPAKSMNPSYAASVPDLLQLVHFSTSLVDRNALRMAKISAGKRSMATTTSDAAAQFHIQAQ